MTISGNADFDPRFRPQVGGFDDAHDVRREANRNRLAAESAVEIDRILKSQRGHIAQQALISSTPTERPTLHIVEDGEVEDGDESPFNELGDYLSQSGLSTPDKIALLESLLSIQRHEEALEASRRPVRTHAAQGSGHVIELPLNPDPKKFGPKRIGRT